MTCHNRALTALVGLGAAIKAFMKKGHRLMLSEAMPQICFISLNNPFWLIFVSKNCVREEAYCTVLAFWPGII